MYQSGKDKTSAFSQCKKTKHLFRVDYNLENYFCNAEEALAYYSAGLTPRKPVCFMPGENSEIPRISVCPSVAQAITAIGSRPFFRASYQSGAVCADPAGVEAYPIIISEYCTSDYLEPHEISPMVFDALLTEEHWITKPSYPVNCQLVWIDQDSCLWDDTEDVLDSEGKPLEFKRLLAIHPISCEERIHPWLTPGKGNVMASEFGEDYAWSVFAKWGIDPNDGRPIGQAFKDLDDRINGPAPERYDK